MALALLTLNLSLLGAGAACATGAHESAAATTTNDATHAGVMHDGVMYAGAMHDGTIHGGVMHTAHAPAVASGPSSLFDGAPSGAPPCEAPGPSNCCRALTSCSIVFSTRAVDRAAHVSSLSLIIAAGASDVPPSETTAPEPPPPKVLPA